MRFSKIEEIEVWRRSMELATQTYQVTSKGAIERDWGLRDQMRRAAVSIPSNIAEGFERNSEGDFNRFLLIESFELLSIIAPMARHCERSEAISPKSSTRVDCFARLQRARNDEHRTALGINQRTLIATGSVGELRSKFILAIQIGYFTEELSEPMIEECSAISAMLGGLSKHLLGSKT